LVGRVGQLPDQNYGIRDLSEIGKEKLKSQFVFVQIRALLITPMTLKQEFNCYVCQRYTTKKKEFLKKKKKKKKLIICHRRIQHIDYDFIIDDCTIFFFLLLSMLIYTLFSIQ
jgi:uncharacterized membrane protein